jgi:hypothetical protein
MEYRRENYRQICGEEAYAAYEIDLVASEPALRGLTVASARNITKKKSIRETRIT